ncbi:hypothetical protein [Novosphingopyxis sp.]|uniref:hypothetical protein n=1 Tax=Novosphingopyxis sp. TaxID=2709690 RepID=UPI003B59C0CA
MARFKFLPAFLIALTLTACATPQTRVRNGLTGLGLSYPLADCMSERMVDRLSLSQLGRLTSLDGFKHRKPGDISINEFVRVTRGLQDPEVLGVVASSGAICAVTS